MNQDSLFQVVSRTVEEDVMGYREETIAHASDLTRQLNIEHVVVSYEGLFGFSLDEALDWKDEREISSCSVCGVFRRRAIDEAGLEARVDVVECAHSSEYYGRTVLVSLLAVD